jgi:hypothetical protein
MQRFPLGAPVDLKVRVCRTRFARALRLVDNA